MMAIDSSRVQDRILPTPLEQPRDQETLLKLNLKISWDSRCVALQHVTVHCELHFSSAKLNDAMSPTQMRLAVSQTDWFKLNCL